MGTIVDCSIFEILFIANLRALVFHPQVDAHERVWADDVRARVVGRAVAFEVLGHCGLAPLGAVQGGGEGEVLALEADVVHATWKKNRCFMLVINHLVNNEF